MMDWLKKFVMDCFLMAELMIRTKDSGGFFKVKAIILFAIINK